MSICGIIFIGEIQVLGEKPAQCNIFEHTNLIWIKPGSNQVLRCEVPVTNCRNHSTSCIYLPYAMLKYRGNLYLYFNSVIIAYFISK